MVAVLGVVGSSLLYAQNRENQRLLSASGEAGQTDTQKLVRQVSKLIVLPNDERPTVATVSDSGKLPRQIFFQHARNGDKVLIYTKAKTAILYDPKQNLILAVSPLNIKTAADSAQ
jgi:hypothetical protein